MMQDRHACFFQLALIRILATVNSTEGIMVQQIEDTRDGSLGGAESPGCIGFGAGAHVQEAQGCALP